MPIMAFIQKLRVPLYAKKKRVRGQLNGFDHTILCDCCRDQARGHLFHRLMMGAIDAKGLFLSNAMKKAVCRHANGMADTRCRQQ